MALFDADELQNMEVEGAMETSLPPIPEGEWPAYVREISFRSGTSEAGNDWTACDVTWAITDPQVVDIVGIDEPTARQTIFLDVGDSGLELGPGKNLQLGRLREALGQNGPGAWSFAQLEGASAVVRVEHNHYNDRIYNDVKSVAAA